MSRIPQIEAGVRALFARADPRFPRSAWFYDTGIEAYLRIGQRYVDAQMGVYLTISNMSAIKLRQGYMREMFVFCEGFAEAHPVFDGTFVESVLAPEIMPFLAERGYRKLAGTDPFGDGRMGNFVRFTQAKANRIKPCADEAPQHPVSSRIR